MLIEVCKLSNLSASIASRVYPNNSLSGQLVQSGRTRDRGVNIVSVPTKSGRLATMLYPCLPTSILAPKRGLQRQLRP